MNRNDEGLSEILTHVQQTERAGIFENCPSLKN